MAAAIGALLAVLLAATPGQAQDTRPDSTRETFQDWVVQCVPSQDPAIDQLCETFQQIDHQQTSNRFLLFSIRFEGGDPTPVAVIVAPFGLRLSDGVQIRTDETVVASYPFETCLPSGCVVVGPLDPPMVNALRSGTDLTVVVTARNGEGIGIPLSLDGFARAMDRLADLSSLP